MFLFAHLEFPMYPWLEETTGSSQSPQTHVLTADSRGAVSWSKAQAEIYGTSS